MNIFANLRLRNILISIGIGIEFMLIALFIQSIIDDIPEIIISI